HRRARRSREEGRYSGAGKPRARGAGALREDVETGLLERLQRRQPAAREQADCASDPAADPPTQDLAAAQQATRAFGLELEQPAERFVRPVELSDSEA